MPESIPDGWQQDAAAPEVEQAPPTTICWRCGKPAPLHAAACPVCQARLAAATEPLEKPQSSLAAPVTTMLWIVGAQLLVGVLFGMSTYFDQNPAEVTRLTIVLSAEAVDTAIVLIGLCFLAPAVVPAIRPSRLQLTVWLWSWPALALLLLINLGYHRLINSLLRATPEMLVSEMSAPYRVWWIVAICAQPAIIEELCFRGIVPRSLTPIMSMKAAVLISSAAFAMAHLGGFLSIPYLFVLGLFLGTARTLSGGLVLPMLLHAAHNAFVLWLERIS